MNRVQLLRRAVSVAAAPAMRLAARPAASLRMPQMRLASSTATLSAPKPALLAGLARGPSAASSSSSSSWLHMTAPTAVVALPSAAFSSSSSSQHPLHSDEYVTTGAGHDEASEAAQRRPADFKGAVTVVRHVTEAYAKQGREVQQITRAVLALLGMQRFDVAVILCMEEESRRAAKRHLGSDAPTDVLSLPMMEPRGEMDVPEFGDVADLGEVMLCLPYIDAQARARGVGSECADELPVILVHGLLHLCGFDHDTRAARDRMQGATDVLMKALHAQGLVSASQLALARAYELDDAPEALSPEAAEAKRARQQRHSSAIGDAGIEEEQARAEAEAAFAAGGFGGAGAGAGAGGFNMGSGDPSAAEAMSALGLDVPFGASPEDAAFLQMMREQGCWTPEGGVDRPKLFGFLWAIRPPGVTEERVRADVDAIAERHTAALAQRLHADEMRRVADEAAAVDAQVAEAEIVGAAAAGDDAEVDADGWRGPEELERDAQASPRVVRTEGLAETLRHAESTLKGGK